MNRRNTNKARRGTTLIEVTFSAAILSVLLLALFGVLIVSFIDRDVETVDGLSDGATLGVLVGPAGLLAAAAVLSAGFRFVIRFAGAIGSERNGFWFCRTRRAQSM